MFQFLSNWLGGRDAAPAEPVSDGPYIVLGPAQPSVQPVASQSPAPPAPSYGVTQQLLWFPGPATRLSASDVEAAAQEIGCDAAAVWAVCDQKGMRAGFIAAPDNRPRILFEPAKFSRHTNSRYDTAMCSNGTPLSIPVWKPGTYGHSGSAQWDRLVEAANLGLKSGDYANTRAAAMMAASYGMFQVLGENFAEAGFLRCDDFVRAHCQSEHAHLETFVVLAKKRGLAPALCQHDWPTFGRRWNGPGQVAAYVDSIAKHYRNRLASA